MPECRLCRIGSDHPGISLDGEGVCNLCRLDVGDEMQANVRRARATYEEFLRAGRNPRAAHDCVFLFSGGKDSTYMLDRFAGEMGLRVLAYTFDVPFESVHAAGNIRLARERIAATFLEDRDDENITKLMRHVFARATPQQPGRYLDEKLPCVSCRTFFVLRAILLAWREHIPYVVLCADPQQIATIESDAGAVVQGFYRTFGRELVEELFGRELEPLLFAEPHELPRMVFPFVAEQHSYDAGAIVAALEAKGLYASSPLETHCTLLPLLNYYSFHHWNCMFYKLNACSQIRAAAKSDGRTRPGTFSIRFPSGPKVLDAERRLKDVVFALAKDEGDRAAHERELVSIFRDLDASEDAASFVARSFVAMRETAQALGIEIR